VEAVVGGVLAGRARASEGGGGGLNGGRWPLAYLSLRDNWHLEGGGTKEAMSRKASEVKARLGCEDVRI
jgi:hypothetical protein